MVPTHRPQWRLCLAHAVKREVGVGLVLLWMLVVIRVACLGRRSDGVIDVHQDQTNGARGEKDTRGHEPSPQLIDPAVLTRKNTVVPLAGMVCGPR